MRLIEHRCVTNEVEQRVDAFTRERRDLDGEREVMHRSERDSLLLSDITIRGEVGLASNETDHGRYRDGIDAFLGSFELLEVIDELGCSLERLCIAIVSLIHRYQGRGREWIDRTLREVMS